MKNKKDLSIKQNAPEKVGKEQQSTTPRSLRQLDKLDIEELDLVVGAGRPQNDGPAWIEEYFRCRVDKL